MASAEAAGNIVVRSLGRSGALGAVRFLTALRREGQAAEPPVSTHWACAAHAHDSSAVLLC